MDAGALFKAYLEWTHVYQERHGLFTSEEGVIAHNLIEYLMAKTQTGEGGTK